MTLRLESSDAVVVVDPSAGGRIAQLTVLGRDLLVGRVDDPLQWGCFPMVPWAGRMRNAPMHGLGFDRPWEVISPNELRLALDWEFGGSVVQRFALRAGMLEVSMEVLAGDQSMPVACGWHPWFRRPVSVSLDAGAMFERGSDYLPTGRLIAPTPPPWDDCFTQLRRPPSLRWPDGLTMTIAGTEHFVVYTEPAHAICVEPQTSPPNASEWVEAGDVFTASATFAWSVDD